LFEGQERDPFSSMVSPIDREKESEKIKDTITQPKKIAKVAIAQIAQ
jgi:hypothetical protein